MEKERLQEQLSNVLQAKNVMQRTLTEQMASLQEIAAQCREDRRLAVAERDRMSGKLSELERKERGQREEI